MGFDFAGALLKNRQIVHETLAVPAVYEDPFTKPTGITVRWHNKIVRNGPSEQGYDAVIVEGIDRLVFFESNLATAGVTLQKNGIVKVPSLGDARFRLEVLERKDGPENIYWMVSNMTGTV